MNIIKFKVTRCGTLVIKRELQYDKQLCCGEVIRNICVNVGIDPDTIDGYTRNVTIYREGGDIWIYDPYDTLEEAGLCNEEILELKMT